MDKITQKDLVSFSKKFNQDSKNILAKNAVTSTKLNNVLINRDVVQERRKVFSKEIDVKVDATNQKSSGRCWLFAFLNVLRLKMIKKYKLDEDFEFSQSYLFFWDKLEKSNFFLNSIMQSRTENLDSRLLSYLLKEPTSDGGQWNMLVNLVNKYGVIPKCCMHETYQSSHSNDLNNVLNNKLRDFAEKIRSSRKGKFDINKALQEIYNILVIFLGEPPKKITWEYYSEKSNTKSKQSKQSKQSKKYNIVSDISPLDFYKKHVPFNVDKMICLVNAPITSRPYYHLFNLKYFGNVIDGAKTNYVNIPIKEMKDIVKKSITGDDAVWFGGDVDKYFDNTMGILDVNAFDYKKVFGFDIDLTKGQRLEYCMSTITHAMVLKGYDLKNRKVSQWLVENSWGDENELQGDLIMSDGWFDEYVWEVVVDKKYVPKKVKDVLKKKAIELEPWDYFGELL